MYFQITDRQSVEFLGGVPPWAADGQMAASPWKDESGWHMVGRGFTNAEPVPRSHLFLAHGQNPFTFTIDPKPLLSPGSPGSSDELAVEDPTIFSSSGFGRGMLFTCVRRMPPEDYGKFGKKATRLHVYASLWFTPVFDSTALTDTLLEPTTERWWERPVDMCKEGEVLLRQDERYDILFFEFGDGGCVTHRRRGG